MSHGGIFSSNPLNPTDPTQPTNDTSVPRPRSRALETALSSSGVCSQLRRGSSRTLAQPKPPQILPTSPFSLSAPAGAHSRSPGLSTPRKIPCRQRPTPL